MFNVAFIGTDQGFRSAKSAEPAPQVPIIHPFGTSQGFGSRKCSAFSLPNLSVPYGTCSFRSAKSAEPAPQVPIGYIIAILHSLCKVKKGGKTDESLTAIHGLFIFYLMIFKLLLIVRPFFIPIMCS